MAADNRADLGPWQDAHLRATTETDAGLGADAGVPAEVRFSIKHSQTCFAVAWLSRPNHQTLNCPPFSYCTRHLHRNLVQCNLNGYLCSIMEGMNSMERYGLLGPGLDLVTLCRSSRMTTICCFDS